MKTMNKKGFTLIELLAVIAILAILVVIAVPNVLNLFTGAKKNAFVTQAQSIYKAAQTTYVNDQFGTDRSNVYANVSLGTGSSSGKQIELQGTTDVKYCVKFTGGAVTYISVSNGSYRMTVIDNTSVSIDALSESAVADFDEDATCSNAATGD